MTIAVCTVAFLIVAYAAFRILAHWSCSDIGIHEDQPVFERQWRRKAGRWFCKTFHRHVIADGYKRCTVRGCGEMWRLK